MNGKWSSFLVASVLIAALLFLSRSAYVDKESHENIIVEQNIQTSCMAAVSTIDTTETFAFDKESKRLDASNGFWKNYCKSMGYYQADNTDGSVTIDEGAKFNIPCVFYVDVDGYYIEYTKPYMSYDGTVLYEKITTGKQSFVSTYMSDSGNRVHVTYYLNGNVEAEAKLNGQLMSAFGYYADVYKELGEPAELQTWDTPAGFWNEHDRVIQTAISNKINYYINMHNQFNNLKNETYTFAMPNEVSSFGRMIRTPCVITFAQEAQMLQENINIYAFAGVSLEKEALYYMYRDDDGQLIYNGEYLSEQNYLKKAPMDELAAEGATPSFAR